PLDGRSLVPWLAGATPPDRPAAVLVESHDQVSGEAGPFFAIRTERWMYTEYQDGGERERYDMSGDPYQCVNLYPPAPTPRVQELSQDVHRLAGCRGAGCIR